jgi:hypothetical protein
MSAAEIADNKWELESSKPPIKDAGAILQIVLMSGLGMIFVWIIFNSLLGAVTPAKDGGLEQQFKGMKEQKAP